MAVAFHVLLLVAGIALLQALIWIPIILWMRKRRLAALAALDAEITSSGERVRRGPESAVYRGATGTYSEVKGNCLVILTDRRLCFVKLTGGRVEVPSAEIAKAREEAVFRASVVRGRKHVVVSTQSGEEIGFFSQDNAAWLAALAALPHSGSTP